jgi:ectoine hydroxylase-related dioxygenase (phytanoyl-CoA dioxygenase family)
MMTCWISLDDTTKDAGTIEYVPGSVEPSPLSVDAWLVTTPVR